MRIAVVADDHHDVHTYRVVGGALLPCLKAAGLELELYEPGWPLPQSRAALHLCDPDWAMPLQGKRNFLISCRTRLGTLEPSRMGLFEFFLCFTKDQAKQAAEALAPYGVLVGDIEPAPMPLFLQADTARSLLKIDGRPLRFLWHGSPHKPEWEFLLSAWRDAFAGDFYKTAHLTVIGSGNGGPDVEQPHGITLDRQDRRTDPEWAELYARHDVVIGTQTWGFGLGVPFADAQAAGCLLVGPKLGCLQSLVSGETAVPVDHPRLLAAALRATMEGWGTDAFEVTRARGIAQARARSWLVIAEKIVEKITALSYKGMRAVS